MEKAFLTLTPQLVALAGYLWEERHNQEAWKIPKIPGMLEVFENTATANSAYSYGDIIDGLQGHLLIVGLHMLYDQGGSHLNRLGNLCCLNESEKEAGTDGPVVEQKDGIFEMLAQAKGSASFEDLDEDGKEQVDHEFDKRYTCLNVILENLLNEVGALS